MHFDTLTPEDDGDLEPAQRLWAALKGPPSSPFFTGPPAKAAKSNSRGSGL